MAPPTSSDVLLGRRFGVIIDAGSSGSRLQIYSWKDPRTLDKTYFKSLPRIEKGSLIAEDWQKKIEPGISSFATDPSSVSAYLAPLLSHAREHISPSQESLTPIFLFATAGMRLLPSDAQKAILQETCNFFQRHSRFRVGKPDESGPCGESVRIISGGEEGVFGWIAVNYLMGGFAGAPNGGDIEEARKTYGFLDMGGASAQIAFEPELAHQGDGQDLVDVQLRLIGGEEVKHKVFTTTWLGYGSNQARARYVTRIVQEHLALTENTDQPIPDPCLPKNLRLSTIVNPSTISSTAKEKYDVIGTGSFSACLTATLPTLEKSATCPEHRHSCPFGGTPVPPISFADSHFVGVSEYWYSSAQAFGLDGEWNYAKFEERAKDWCGKSWNTVEAEAQTRHRLDSSKEDTVDEQRSSPEADEVAQAAIEVELSHLRMQCFKAAWVANVLHEGIGMPRTVDMDPSTVHNTPIADAPRVDLDVDGPPAAEQVAKQGSPQKQIIRKKPQFQSVDTIGDMAVSWTLGKMVLEASKDVPNRSKPKPHHSPPTVNPPNNDIESDSRPPYQYSSTSIRPSLILFYLLALLAFSVLLWRFRRHIRVAWRRTIQSSPFFSTISRLFSDTSTYARMEQGLSTPLRDPPSFTNNKKPSRHMPRISLPRTTNNPNGRYNNSSPQRISPIRSHSFPAGLSISGSSSGRSTSRAASPAPPGFSVAPYTNSHVPSGILTPRSRNTSQANLTADFSS